MKRFTTLLAVGLVVLSAISFAKEKKVVYQEKAKAYTLVVDGAV